MGTDPGDGHPSSSTSSSIDSANLEGEAHPVEFDTALPVEHNVSIHGASREGETWGAGSKLGSSTLHDVLSIA